MALKTAPPLVTAAPRILPPVTETSGPDAAAWADNASQITQDKRSRIRILFSVLEKEGNVFRQVHLPVRPAMSAAGGIEDVFHFFFREHVGETLDGSEGDRLIFG